ncbi:hypothetical protein [Paenibacillus larvae]|uniref:hypothetical protein n=1 Tax=Paenibacillus larvae TaxID=1464 RepID=UPI00288FAD7B|nr:hypothetical protein [Paenibacillus larvae]MDT2191098.1 hypothetical protein [Paenibacillus larvae]
MKKKKKYDNKYWEMEKGKRLNLAAAILCGAMIKPGNCNSVQVQKQNTGEDVFQVKFVLDVSLVFERRSPELFMVHSRRVGRND